MSATRDEGAASLEALLAKLESSCAARSERVDALERAVHALACQLALQQDATSDLLTNVLAMKRDLEPARAVGAFFEPMLRGKAPPLDGAQVADRAYVDEAVARLARAVRRKGATDAQPSITATPKRRRRK